MADRPFNGDFATSGDMTELKPTKITMPVAYAPVADLEVATKETSEAVFTDKLLGFDDTGIYETYTGDLNDIAVNSTYKITPADVTNEPTDLTALKYSFIQTLSYNTTNVTQLIFGMDTGDAYKVWVRSNVAGSWNAWSLVVDPTILKQADIDDTPVNGELDAPISSNRMFDHEAGTAGQHAAADITYDNAVSGLTATDVKAAIDEVSPVGSNWHECEILLPTTNPATETILQSSDAVLPSFEFDPDASKYISFNFRLPWNYVGNQVLMKLLWTHAATTTNFDVRWYWNTSGAGWTGDLITDDSAGGAASTVTGGVTNTYYLFESGVNVSGYAVAGELVTVYFRRDAVNAADTLDAVSRVHKIYVKYQVDSGFEE